MKGQSPYDRRGSDDGTEARTKYELNPSSEMASKTNPTNSDSKAERKKKKLSKKRKLLEESRVILDGE